MCDFVLEVALNRDCTISSCILGIILFAGLDWCRRQEERPKAWRVLTAQCDISPVCTQILSALNVAQKWIVGTERNSLVMLFVCMGTTHFGGIVWAQ